MDNCSLKDETKIINKSYNYIKINYYEIEDYVEFISEEVIMEMNKSVSFLSN